MLQKLVFTLIICCMLIGYKSHAEITVSPKSQLANKPFVHPGMAQSRQDLDYMKQQALSGNEPWKSAFERLKRETSADFKPKPFAHVSVGPYGKNSIGGKELSESANAAYANAILWYITDDKVYARKAIEILNAWSNALWDFGGNNAKLNVGLTSFQFLNAAEILKCTKSGWGDPDIQQFKRLMLGVYYPTVKDFFTEANGNWDAAIINSLFCIGIFTDNHEIFDLALERFYHGPGNSGITKYIYPGGQIQETTRDWGHVQLGIGEFSKAVQVAWTQGIDLYSVADNRLAQGYEYTSKYLLGGKVHVYGQISERDKDSFRDIYESIYDHYIHEKNIKLPFTERVIQEKTRPKSSLALLTSIRYYPKQSLKNPTILSASEFIPFAGALEEATAPPPDGSVKVNPGESIQEALDKTAGTGRWVVLSKGIHELNATLQMPNNVTLAGQGKETILFLKPESQMTTIVNANKDMHAVVIRDLSIEGATSTEIQFDPNNERRKRSYMSAPSREGILFSADREHQMNHIRLENITIRNFTQNGLSVCGADQVMVKNCDIVGNGSNVVPGAGFHHNLRLNHVNEAEISNSRFDDSLWGSGVDISFSQNISVSNCEASRNKISGIRCTESKQITVTGCLSEGNDINGFSFDALMDGSDQITVKNNRVQYNKDGAIPVEKCKNCIFTDNKLIGNGLKNEMGNTTSKILAKAE